MAATALTEEGEPDVEAEPDDPALQKRPRDLDLPPWLKGRYGTAVGRAVHGVLQTIDLATGDGLDAAVASQCEAEAVVGRSRRGPAAGDRSPGVAVGARGRGQSATGGRSTSAPRSGDRLLEGYIDLLYRGPDGLVVVDYKTAATSDPDRARPSGSRAIGSRGRRTLEWSGRRPANRCRR